MTIYKIKTRILTLTFLLSFIFLLSNFIYAIGPDTEPCWVKGTITGDGITVSGLTVAAYNGSTLLKSAIIEEEGEYSLNSIGANDGDTVSLKVYGATFDDFNFEGYCRTEDEGPWVVRDFEVSKVANGTSCNADAICTSGYCNANDVCANEPTDGGNNGGSTGGSTGGTTTPTTTTQTFTSTNTPSPSEIAALLSGSGLTESEIQAYVDAANSGELEITTTLAVKGTTSGGSTTYVSTFTITITNNSGEDLEDITIVEVIPKNIAASASEITSLAQFRVLVDDPVLEFTIGSLNAGQSTTINYTINKRIAESAFLEMPGAIAKGSVVAVIPPTGEVDVTPGTTPGTTPTDQETTQKASKAWIWILLIVVIIVGIILLLSNKKRRQFFFSFSFNF